jgi:hypothetical protein
MMPGPSRRKPRSDVTHSAESAGAEAKKTRRAKPRLSDGPDVRADEGVMSEITPVANSEESRPRAAPPPQVTRAWVLERLAENVNRAMQIEEIKLRGVPTGEYRYEGSVANRALELLGKELGLFVERNESVNIHHVVSDEPLTQAQWEERYATPR